MDYNQLLRVALDRAQIEIMTGSCSGEKPFSSSFEAIGEAKAIEQALLQDINKNSSSSKKEELAIKLAAIYLRISIETSHK